MFVAIFFFFFFVFVLRLSSFCWFATIFRVGTYLFWSTGLQFSSCLHKYLDTVLYVHVYDEYLLGLIYFHFDSLTDIEYHPKCKYDSLFYWEWINVFFYSNLLHRFHIRSTQVIYLKFWNRERISFLMKYCFNFHKQF